MHDRVLHLVEKSIRQRFRAEVVAFPPECCLQLYGARAREMCMDR